MADAVSTTRRAFLKHAPIAASLVAVPVSLAEARHEMTAEERFQHHLDGLKQAAKDLDPRIGDWVVRRAENDELNASLLIMASRVTGSYQGDGIYEGGGENIRGGRTSYNVELLPARENGQRVFLVSTEMDRMTLSEQKLNTFIGRRVS